MIKKVYSAPALHSEKVELGVFGCYGQQKPPVAFKPKKHKGWFFWWLW